MIPPSARYAPALAAVVILVLVPVAWYRLEPPRVDDCANPPRLREVGDLEGSHKPREHWEKYDEEVIQWSRMEVTTDLAGVVLEAVIIRSYRPVRLYTRPPAALLGTFEAEQREVVEIHSGNDTLPVQTIFDATRGRDDMASYLFVYGGEPVAHPFWSSLASAPAQVVRGTRPLTLILVAGDVPRSKRPAAQRRAERFIEDAWRLYREACLAPSSAAARRAVSGSRGG